MVATASMSIRKTMFFCVLVRGRAAEPYFEMPRLSWLWCPKHRIPACFPSCEIQITRPILLHCGHFVWSPMLTIFCPTFLLVVDIRFSTCFPLQCAMNSYRWFTFSTVGYYTRPQNAQSSLPLWYVWKRIQLLGRTNLQDNRKLFRNSWASALIKTWYGFKQLAHCRAASYKFL